MIFLKIERMIKVIKLIRLDERLIHGQVAIKWSRHTGVDRIVVINNQAASNLLIQKSLMMAAPSTVKVAIKDVKAGIKLLQDPRLERLKVLVIVSEIKDLLVVLKNVVGIPLINIGNYGRLATKKSNQKRTAYRPNLYAYDEELELLKEVASLGIETVYQTIPDDNPEKLLDIIS